ncbi:MAG: GDP-mannose 4,6-dehydratase, partial [Pirellulales bacterium]
MNLSPSPLLPIPPSSSPPGSPRRRALITGVTGQDGSYLAELLLANGYDCLGLVRRSSSLNFGRIDHIPRPASAGSEAGGRPRFLLEYADLTDANSLSRVIHHFQPHEVYNLGAQSHVRVS